MNAKRVLCAAMVFVLILATVLSGCGSGNSNPTESSAGSASTAPATTPEVKGEKISLKFWMPYAPYEGMTWNDHPFFKEMETRTNVHVDVEGPAAGQDVNEAYKTMIASGNLPDVIQQIGNTYADGQDKAISDGVYIRLNEYIEKDMPNFKQFLDASPIVKKIITSPEGNIVHFPNSRPADATRQPPYVGPIIRYDWLEKVGLSEPETLEDWHAMLVAFKQQLGVDRPLTLPKEGGFFMSSPFLSAYDVGADFYVVDGKIKYGPLEDNFINYITEMKKWYSEGLLELEDQNEEKFYNDTRGAWCHGYYMLEAWKSKAKDPNYRAVGVKYPVLAKGNTINLFYGDAPATDFGFGFVITTANKYPDETCKYFDYWYGEEGTTLALYGIEGKTYTLVGGKPQFTEYMTKNPDGKPFVQALKENTVNYLLNDWHIELAGFKPDEQEAIGVKWAEVKDTWSLPGYAQQFTAEESQKINELWDPINKYVLSMLPKFIKGEESLNNWGALKDQVKKMGVEEIMKVRQTAYDRFFSK